jgi:hypothetical protein
MDTTKLTPTRARRLRSQLWPGLIGLGLGVGSTLLLLYALRGVADVPFVQPAVAPFQVTGALPAAASTDDPVNDKKTAAAKAIAEKILDAIAMKDASAILPMCDIPFLGGAPHNQRLIKDRDELTKALNDDLCQGPYAPFMFERKWDASTVLLPAEFQEQYSDFLVNHPNTKLLELLHLTLEDRVVVEHHRGMLLIVRAGSDESRAIGIIPIGFRSLKQQFKLTRDVIYGRKYGTVLTLDVLQPLKRSNFGHRSRLVPKQVMINTQGSRK